MILELQDKRQILNEIEKLKNEPKEEKKEQASAPENIEVAYLIDVLDYFTGKLTGISSNNEVI